MIEKYQEIYKALKLIIDNASEDSENNMYLYDQLVIVFRAIKNSMAFQYMDKETLRRLLLKSFLDALQDINKTFPEDQIRNSIKILANGELNYKYIEIIVENLRQYMSLKYLERARIIIKKVIDEEWEEK